MSVGPAEPEAGDVFGFNRYAYAANNPLTNVDLDGRQACGDSGCTVGPITYNFFRDSFVGGGAIGHEIGDPIALARSDSVNPITHERLNGAQIQDAKLGVLMMAVPAPLKIASVVADSFKEVALSLSAHGEAAEHAAAAIAAGKPSVLTINWAGAVANRRAATGDVAKVPGKQLDEYPPAMFKEGGLERVCVLSTHEITCRLAHVSEMPVVGSQMAPKLK